MPNDTVTARLTGTERTIAEARRDPDVWPLWVARARAEMRYHRMCDEAHEYGRDWDLWRAYVKAEGVMPSSFGQAWWRMKFAQTDYDGALRLALERRGKEGRAALRVLDRPRKVTLPPGKWGADWRTTTKADAWRDWWPAGKVRGY